VARPAPDSSSVVGLSTRFLWELEGASLAIEDHKAMYFLDLSHETAGTGRKNPSKRGFLRSIIYPVYPILTILPKRNKLLAHLIGFLWADGLSGP
jgi:hypothetical protein